MAGMSETAKVTATLIGLPLLGVLLAILYLTPRYIPSEALARAALDAGAGEPGGPPSERPWASAARVSN
jgi:hypothetical protein